jgi:hypothetical protein
MTDHRFTLGGHRMTPRVINTLAIDLPADRWRFFLNAFCASFAFFYIL